MGRRIPLWLRIAVAVLLAALLIAVIFTGGSMLLDIWADNY
jgi:type VI protein secretion system component VasF